MSLHTAGKAFALCDAADVDELADLEPAWAHHRTYRYQPALVPYSEFANLLFGCDTLLRVMAQLGPCDIPVVSPTVPYLHCEVAVLLSRLVADDLASVQLKKCDGYPVAVGRVYAAHCFLGRE